MKIIKGKKNYNYFQAFVELSEFSLKAAEMLIKALYDFDKNQLDGIIREMHVIEHTADNKRHELLNKLAKEFLPPIEREDIMSLSEKIDDVTDSVEDVLLNISIFNVNSIPQKIIEFTEVIVKCCRSLISALKEFENFRKSKKLHDEIIELNRLEEVGDALYVNGVRELYRSKMEPIDLIIWKEVFASLEKCCDACEDVANDIENIVMKNS